MIPHEGLDNQRLPLVMSPLRQVLECGAHGDADEEGCRS